MNRIAAYIDEILTKLLKKAPQSDFVLKISNKGKREGFQLSYCAGKITIEVENHLAAAYALNRLSVALDSNQLAEILGKNDPYFSLRPLWFLDYNVLNFNEAKAEKVCRRLIEWGYNAICLGLNLEDLDNESLNDSLKSLEVFHQFGLKLIIKFQVPDTETLFLNTSYRKQFQKRLSKLKENKLDYLLWKGSFLNPSIRQQLAHHGMLHRDFAREEVQFFENSFCGSLIYFVPFDRGISKQEDWLPDFLDDVGKNTIIAFPAVAGHEIMDHLSSHPLWYQLRQCPDVSSTPLLPIINGGLIGQGEGCWPVLPLDIIERFVPRCYRHHFAGTLVLAKHLPGKEGWLDASLWISGQSQWSNLSSPLLAETWFAAFRSDINYPSIAPFLKDITWLVKGLNRLRTEEIGSEESKALGDSLFAKLKALSSSFASEISSQSSRPKISDYLAVFQKEVQKTAAPFISLNRNLNILESNEQTAIEQRIREESFEPL